MQPETYVLKIFFTRNDKNMKYSVLIVNCHVFQTQVITAQLQMISTRWLCQYFGFTFTV